MIKIRRYQPSDYHAVWELHKSALVEAGAFSETAADTDLNQIEAVYLDNGGEFLVGTLQGRIISMGALMRTAPNRAEVRRMRVHPDFQRRGFGQAMLEILEKRAKELGCSVLHLDTDVRLVGAQHFYAKNSFKEVRRGKIASLDCIFYEKRI